MIRHPPREHDEGINAKFVAILNWVDCQVICSVVVENLCWLSSRSFCCGWEFVSDALRARGTPFGRWTSGEPWRWWCFFSGEDLDWVDTMVVILSRKEDRTCRLLLIRSGVSRVSDTMGAWYKAMSRSAAYGRNGVDGGAVIAVLGLQICFNRGILFLLW